MSFKVIVVIFLIFVSVAVAFSPKNGRFGRSIISVSNSMSKLKALIECQQGDFEKDVIKPSMEAPVIVDFYAGMAVFAGGDCANRSVPIDSHRIVLTFCL